MKQQNEMKAKKGKMKITIHFVQFCLILLLCNTIKCCAVSIPL